MYLYSTVSSFFLKNGRIRSRLTRAAQGDPFSPYLFILAAQALSNGLLEFSSNIICRGISVSRRPPPISHLLLADDGYLFMENNLDHAWSLKWVLDLYCSQAGQNVNFFKSELFLSRPNMAGSDIGRLV